jgi:hypothetical protein
MMKPISTAIRIGSHLHHERIEICADGASQVTIGSTPATYRNEKYVNLLTDGPNREAG